MGTIIIIILLAGTGSDWLIHLVYLVYAAGVLEIEEKVWHCTVLYYTVL